MNLGWPLTILLVLAIVAVIVLFMRADRDYQRRKLNIVQKKLAALDAKKPEQESTQQQTGQLEPGDGDDCDPQS